MAVKVIPLTINAAEQSQIISELEVLHRVSLRFCTHRFIDTRNMQQIICCCIGCVSKFGIHLML